MTLDLRMCQRGDIALLSGGKADEHSIRYLLFPTCHASRDLATDVRGLAVTKGVSHGENRRG